MAGGYKAPKDGIAAVLARFADLERRVNAIAAAAGLESAVIGKGGITINDAGQIVILDPVTGAYSFRVTGSGALSTADRSAGRGALLFGGNLRLYPDIENTLIYGRVATGDDGQLLLTSPIASHLTSEGQVVVRSDQILFLTGAQIQLNATGSNGIGLYGTPTTSSAANMFLGTVSGQWQVARVTSSRQYKQDIADAPIDPRAALSWRPRVWRDKAEVEAVGDDAPTQIGFVAEEINEVSPEFVIRDEHGAPNALAYDRMVAGLTVTVQAQQAQIDEQDQKIAALIDANAALAARLDAREADRG